MPLRQLGPLPRRQAVAIAGLEFLAPNPPEVRCAAGQTMSSRPNRRLKVAAMLPGTQGHLWAWLAQVWLLGVTTACPGGARTNRLVDNLLRRGASDRIC